MPPVLSPHPKKPRKIATIFDGSDVMTKSSRQHRILAELPGGRSSTIEFLRKALVTHHTTAVARRDQSALVKALKRQGLPDPPSSYPTSKSTQKGNLAEVLLAEYIIACEKLTLPVYRLHYNGNIDQSMKGDDVLAFDLDSKPPRVVVGESKYRALPTSAHAKSIVKGLQRSYRGKIPASLSFVANALYKSKQNALAKRITRLKLNIARNQVQVDYVGLLMGGAKAAVRVTDHTPGGAPQNLAMISLELVNGNTMIANCFRDLK